MQNSGVSSFRYYAFISYSHQDKAWADWLHKVLETYAVPKRLVGQTTAAGAIPKRLTPVFRDRDELASAHDLGRKVNEALAQSANLIVICSPRSAASRWVQEEVLAYKRLGRAEQVFCLIIDGEPNASELSGREAEECFAAALRFQLDADGQPTTQHAEPIAADARVGKDGKGNAKLKLIAGLLDVGFDTLKRREMHRRNRRLAVIAAFAVAMMAITSTLAVAALFSRHAAEVARVDAQRRQKQAEDLVGFMLGDLNDKLGQVQRLDIMEAVDDKAMAYFASLPTKDVTDKALAERAKALEKIGVIRQGQNHLSTAMDAYQAAAGIAGALARATPADAARQIAYSRVLAYIGMVDWYQGKLDDAQQAFEAAQHALRGAASHAVQNTELIFQLTVIDNNIGHVLEARGHFDQATTQYQLMLNLVRGLTSKRPDNTEWTAQLGTAHNNLGKLALLRGDMATAVTEYRADDAIESTLLARNPKDNLQRENTLLVRGILGRTLAMVGDMDPGKSDLQQAVDMADGLIKIDRGNNAFPEDFARYATQLARLQRLDGNRTASLELTGRALSILEELTRQDSTNTSLQRELAEAKIERAAELDTDGNGDPAREQLKGALSMIDPLLAKQPHDRNLVLSKAAAQLLLANITSDPPAVRALRESVLTTLKAEQGGRKDPRLLALQVEALLSMESTSEARPLIGQLWHTGYRDAQLLATLQHRHIPYPVNPKFQKTLTANTRTR